MPGSIVENELDAPTGAHVLPQKQPRVPTFALWALVGLVAVAFLLLFALLLFGDMHSAATEGF